MSHETGYKAEQHVFSILNQKGIQFTFVDDWYDVDLFNKEKLEIKSCCLSIKQQLAGKRKHEDSYRIGRFDFTDPDNREKIYNANMWVGFVIRFLDHYLLCGFCRSKKLKNKRYITIHDLRRIGLISLDDWIKELNKVGK